MKGCRTPDSSAGGVLDDTEAVEACICRLKKMWWGRWARRWIYHTVCDARPVRRQTYGYLPSDRALPLPLGRYWFRVT